MDDTLFIVLGESSPDTRERGGREGGREGEGEEREGERGEREGVMEGRVGEGGRERETDQLVVTRQQSLSSYPPSDH